MRRYGRDRQLVFPLLLILVGALFLIGNFGLFNRLALWRLGDLWPLLLVLIGGLLVINRLLAPQPARLASLALLAILVIVAAAYVAVSPVSSGGGSLDLKGPVGTLSKAELVLEFGASTLDVQAGSLGDDLYQAHFEYGPGEPTPTASLDRETGTVTIHQNPHFNLFAFSGSRHDQVALRLNDRLPWTIRISGGASQMTLDLSQGHLAGVRISGGASQMDLTLPPPHGTVRVEMSGGASQMRIRAGGSAARINVTGGLGSLQANDSRYAGVGQLSWQTPGYGAATDRYDIQITGGASEVTLNTR